MDQKHLSLDSCEASRPAGPLQAHMHTRGPACRHTCVHMRGTCTHAHVHAPAQQAHMRAHAPMSPCAAGTRAHVHAHKPLRSRYRPMYMRIQARRSRRDPGPGGQRPLRVAPAHVIARRLLASLSDRGSRVPCEASHQQAAD